MRLRAVMVSTVMAAAAIFGLSTPAFGYGPTSTTLASNTPSTSPGGNVQVTGTGFCPNCVVTLTLHSTPVTLGTTTADANGNISAPVTIPSDTVSGQHEIIGTDPDGDSASTAILVGTSAVPAVAASSGLAFTGADIAALSGVGAIAIALGGMLLLMNRRRRSA